MEGRLPAGLHLEMTDASPGEYHDRRVPVWGDARVSLFVNERRDRDDLPRTLAEFDTLAVIEVERATPMPGDDPMILHSLRFIRTPRPGQGSLTGEATNGLQLVLISPRQAEAGQDLRDWADFIHIRHIADAAVPGFRMITPYANEGGGPRFLHFYEMHTSDPEAAFQDMTPRVAARLGGADSEEFGEWAWHSQLHIDYVNTFRRVDWR